MEAGQGRRARPAQLDAGALRARRGPARGVGAAAPVHARLGRAAARGARAATDLVARRARASAPSAAARRSASSASSSRGSRPRRRPPEAGRDRHPLPPRRVRAAGRRARRARARGRGRRGSPRSAWTAPRSSARSPRRDDHDEVVAIVGPPPARGRRASTTPTSRRSSARPAHPRARAIGETGLDYYRDYAPRDDQRRAFEAQLELAARAGLPVVIHTRAAEDDTFAIAARARRRAAGRDPALLLGARPARGVRRARLPLLVRRQRHLPEGDRPPGRRARACPTSCCWSRPTRPTSRRSRCAASRTSRPTWPTPPRFVAELRGVDVRGARARRSSATPRASSGLVRTGSQPRQASLAPAARSSASGRTASSARTS